VSIGDLDRATEIPIGTRERREQIDVLPLRAGSSGNLERGISRKSKHDGIDARLTDQPSGVTRQSGGAAEDFGRRREGLFIAIAKADDRCTLEPAQTSERSVPAPSEAHEPETQRTRSGPRDG
jgi:hypothetical protein